MSQAKKEQLAPFVSLIIMVVITLAFVFVKMEAVRLSYQVLRLQQLHKNAADHKAHLEERYARLTRPERLDLIATRELSLMHAQKNQIVLMAARGDFAVRQ